MSMWDDDAGYDLSDPKHPSWHDRMSGIWDDRDKFVCQVDESGGLADDECDCDQRA